MDTKISGSGQISAGEYKNIRISGSAHLNGLIRCDSFHCSGASSGDATLECKEELSVSGRSKFDRAVSAKLVKISGSCHCGADLRVQQALKTAGTLHCGGAVRCGSLHISGVADVAGDVEAETVDIHGKLDCPGLLNAEEIVIEFSRGMHIGNVGGSSIRIFPASSGYIRVQRLPLLSSLLGNTCGTVHVDGAVEGDTIALERVNAQRVTGRVVAIGAGCTIETVQYSEQLEISPDAKVGRTEKI